MAAIAELDPEAVAMWHRLTEDWNQHALHDAFVQRCFAGGRLAAAGARYREFLQAHPGDAVAERMRARVIFLSTQALLTSERRVRRASFLHAPWFVVVVLLGAALGAVLGFVWGGRR